MLRSLQRLTRQFSSVEKLNKGAIIGIDLGTTNSCVAIMEGGKAKVIENAEGDRTTPSIVGFQEDGQTLVGIPAKRQAVTNPENTIFASKRLIGRRYNDKATQDDMKTLPYKVVKAPNGDAWIRAQKNDYSPSQIGAYTLMKMKETAELYTHDQCNAAVVTVPAYFNDAQRQATKDAGKIADLEVKRIINEPTAAALAFGFEKDDDKVLAVYDLGGGTFDISILQISGGIFEVKATNGDTSLGGEDFDYCLQQHLVKEFKHQHSTDLTGNTLAIQRIREAAEKAKIELSSQDQTTINLPYLMVDASGPKHLETTLTRRQFEELAKDLIERSVKPLQQCLSDSGITRDKVDEVLLVGGMTRMPKVQDSVKNFFGRPPIKGVNPDEAVAIGAAIQGSVLKGDIHDVVLIDVTPLSLGISMVGNIFSRIIPKNTQIPVQKVKQYVTVSDNQTSFDIQVFQGEREMANENKNIGSFQLSGLAMAPKGMAKMDVSFNLDANGILFCKAKDPSTGKSSNITIRSDGGLSPSDIEKMIKDAEANKQSDMRRKELLDLKNEADNTIYNTQNQMTQFKEKLNQEIQDQIQTDITNLQTAIDSDNLDKIKETHEKLKVSAMEIGKAVYQQ